jgi:hypothetical protein
MERKENMKKLILTLIAIAGLAVGCASHDQSQGGSSDEGFNNATHGTGTSTATNSGADATMPQ